MVWRRSHVEWRGDYELEEQYWECQNACMAKAVVVFDQFIPVDVARIKQ